METKKIIEELELNYGYKFNPKEKHEFNWLCNLVKDVETVVSKNELLHIVSDMFSFSAYLECYYSYWDNTELGDIYTSNATGKEYTTEQIYDKWLKWK